MKIITISNLYPRPDQPIRGMFNFQFFSEIEGLVKGSQARQAVETFINICLVTEWRIWRWSEIRKWQSPFSVDQPSTTVYFPVFYLPFLGRSINWWFNYRALKSAYGLSINKSTGNDEKSSITFLASWLYPDAVAVARLAKDIGTPVWLRVHGSDRYHLRNRLRRHLIMGAVDYAKGVICNCQVVADDLISYGVPASKIHIVENGVDTALFRYRTKEELSVNGCQLLVDGEEMDGKSLTNKQLAMTKNGSATSKAILFVGNLVPVKGPDILLRAFTKVVKSLPANPPHLLLIGSGPMLPQLQRLSSKLGIAERVHFLGNRPHDEVAQWMNVVDVLCLASRSEGMPNVVLEARASGLPVVTTPVGAIPELPLNKDHFTVVKSCTPEDLAEGLRDMLSRDLSNRKPDPAIPSWEGMADRILGLIRES